jgi:hypothetical protein
MGCPICSNPSADVRNHPTRDAAIVDCPQCASFTISRSARAIIGNVDAGNRWKISAWISQYQPAVLTSSNLDSALNSTLPSLHTRADRMLRWISSNFPPGRQFSLPDLTVLKRNDSDLIGGMTVEGQLERMASRLIPIGWNSSFEEADYMVTEVLCKEMELLVSQNNHDYQVSPKGLLYLEGRKEEASSIGFCAMWFSEEVAPLWTSVIEPATRLAGYEPLRIDGKQHNGKIDDEIMASIRGSRFVIADFTGSRGGVYYEAGFAHGLGLPVIFMCREGDELHFDVRQYNCIFWKPDELEDAQARLKNRILATLGQGPLKLH